MNYDVIIVGAGPAGLMAANELKNKTDNFLVLDPKKEIGKPLRCGEGMRKEHFIELFSTTDYKFVKNHTNYINVSCKKTKRTLNIDYLMLDRPGFEKWLSPPKEYLKLNTKCIDIKEHKDYIEIITNDSRLRAKIVILAYGCNYFIQKKFNLLESIPITIPCYGGIFKNTTFDRNTLHFFFDDNEKTGFWIFPKKQYVNSGMGIFPHKRTGNLKNLFNDKIEKFSLKGKPTYTGVYPTTGPIRKTYTNRMAVCGNAAGQVYPGTGEGIYYALKSGQLAAITALNKLENDEPMEKYEERWKRAFGNDFKAGKVFAKLLFFGGQKKVLEKMFAIPTNKELKKLFVEGKRPIRSIIAYSFAKILDKSKIL